MNPIVALIVIVGWLVLLGWRSVAVVQAGMAGVVARLGRFHAMHQPGLHFIVPFLDRVTMVSMTQQRVAERIDATTKDDVPVTVDANFFRQVVDARLALYSISNYALAVDLVVRESVRDAVSEITLDELPARLPSVAASVETEVGRLAQKWGLLLGRFEIAAVRRNDDADTADSTRYR